MLQKFEDIERKNQNLGQVDGECGDETWGSNISMAPSCLSLSRSTLRVREREKGALVESSKLERENNDKSEVETVVIMRGSGYSYSKTPREFGFRLSRRRERGAGGKAR